METSMVTALVIAMTTTVEIKTATTMVEQVTRSNSLYCLNCAISSFVAKLHK